MATSAYQEEQKNIESGQEWYSFTTVEGFVKKHFYFLHSASRTRFCSLVKHYKTNGLTLGVQGNSKCLPSSASSIETVENVVKFIMNIAEEKALILAGRVPGFERVNVKLVPSVLTKYSLWKTFEGICASQGHTSVGYSKFCDLWHQLCPFVLIMRPAMDLCWTCQKNNNLIQKTTNLQEEQKVAAVRAQEEHLRLSAGERELYKNCCNHSKDDFHQSGLPHLTGVPHLHISSPLDRKNENTPKLPSIEI